MKRTRPSPNADPTFPVRLGGICLCALLWGWVPAVSCLAAEGQLAPVPSEHVLAPPRLLQVMPGKGRGCGDMLRAAGIQATGLEFLFCRREGPEGRQLLTARYRVRGSEAASVEKLLREQCRMGALVRSLGIWSVPDGGEGRLPLAALRGALPEKEALPEDAQVRVSMGEVPQSGAFAPDRAAWAGIAWFAVRVDVPLDAGSQD